MNKFRWWLGFLMVALLGCSDMGTSPVLIPGPRAPTMSESEWDPPTEWPVKIRSTYGLILMGDQSQTSIVQAHMAYDGYHATISSAATLRDPSGSANFSFGPVERHSFTKFRENAHSAQWKLTTPHACGSILDVNFTYSAWWLGVGLGGEGKLDNQNASRFESGSQLPCNNEQEGNESGENDNDGESGPGGDGGSDSGGEGGGGEGGDGERKYCWWQYNYDAESGEILEVWLVACWYE